MAVPPTKSECIAAYESALKLGKDHQLRAEKAQLLICAAQGCPEEVQEECVKRVEANKTALPAIVFIVKDGAGNDLSAVKVTMDGELLARRLDGSALTVDPGEHKFVFETAGQATLEKSFVICEAQQSRHETVTIGAAPAAPASPPPTTVGSPPGSTLNPTTAASTQPLSPPPAPAGDNGATQRSLGYIIGGAGLVGIGIGAIFGLKMKSKISDRDNVNKCSETSSCTDADVASINQLTRDARSAATISTVGFVAGGVALAGGIVLIITGLPKESKPTSALNWQPWVETNTAGLAMGGIW
jgi:hypothetical protein